MFVDYKPLPTPTPCSHLEHDPPSHVVLPDGLYTWQCPACGHRVTFTVARPTS